MEHEWSTDRLERALIDAEAQIARLRAWQAQVVAELDARQVATADGSRTMGEWVAARADVASETAHRLVRLSHAFRDRPAVFAGMVAEGWSFDRTVASHAWIAAGAGWERVLEDGPRFDIAGLRTRIALTRRLTRHEEKTAFDDRYLVYQRSLDRTRMRLWSELPGHEGDIVERALEATADGFPPLPDGTRPARRQRLADALVAMCADVTSRGEDGGERTAVRRRTPALAAAAGVISVFVDEGAAHTSRGYVVGEGTIDQLMCDAKVEYTAIVGGVATEAGGHRTVSPRQRRRILHRSGVACAVEGCASRHRLEIHHLTPKSAGGTNHDTNLGVFCWYHHHVVIHRRGFRIDPTSPQNRVRLLPPATGPP